METMYEYACRVRRMSGHELMHEARQIMQIIEDDPLPDLTLWHELDIVHGEMAIRN